MAEKVKASDVDGVVIVAANGRPYVRLKQGGSRFVTAADATRLRAELGGKKAGKKAGKKTRKYLGDLL